MSGCEVGGQKWAAGEVGKWRGKEGVSVTYEGAASRMRAWVRCHGQGRSVMDKGAASWTRAQRHGQGRSVMYKGAASWTRAQHPG